ncbi:MAG: CheR family methyltransferase [Cyanobacteria bacterium P01_A01_bin.105]
MVSQPEIAIPPDFFIVGIGASAGGLRAIEEFFDNMPPDSGAAFVVIQHLSPDYRSLMSELLERRTSMAVQRVVDRIQVAPNTVYLIPPGHNLVIDKFEIDQSSTAEGAQLRLMRQERGQGHQLNFPIDLFFQSLAAERQDRAISIVLSGTGSDGSRGIQNVSESGGIVLAQDPISAEFDGMPRSAIATSTVDLILSPSEIAQAVHQFVTSPSQLKEFRDGQSTHLQPTQLQTIINILERHGGVDFTHYKTSTISRRIQRRCLIAGYNDLERYIRQLEISGEERDILRNDLLINVTRFFRDTEAWHCLESAILPSLIEQCSAERPLRIWVAACATGEEAYSMAMVLSELIDAQPNPIEVKIFATDIDPLALERASAGIYPASIVNDVSAERLDRFFTHQADGSYEVSRALRKMIIFANHNLAKDAGFTQMHLVSCRNVLIYMQLELQMQVLRSLHFALVKRGVLFLGQSENLGDVEAEFKPLRRKWKLYEKLRDVRLPLSRAGLATLNVRRTQLLAEPQQTRFDPLLAAAFKALLHNRQATCFLVNRHNELLYLCGDAFQLLSPPVGRASQDILAMLPPSLQLAVSTGLHSARQKKKIVRYNSCRWLESPDQDAMLSIEVSLQPTSISGSEFLMVLIEQEVAPRKVDVSTQFSADTETAQYVGQLEQELQRSRENLQATIEELETTNEEQQATNEELISSNEELQSTNEELQSVNEELHTVNSEYQAKIQELIQLNNDLDNLLSNIDIGVIFLNNAGAIRKFTPAAMLAFNLVESDIGRPLHHLSHNLQNFDLPSFLAPVNEQHQSVEQALRLTNKPVDVLLRARPYLTDQETVSGIILTFVNISEVKQVQHQLELAEAELRQSNERLEAQVKERTQDLENSQQLLNSITQATPNIIYIYDLVEQCNVYTNGFIERVLGYSSTDVRDMGSELALHLFHPDELAMIATHHSRIRQSNATEETIFDIEYRLRTADNQWRWFQGRESIFTYGIDGKPQRILGAAIDVSDRKAAEQQLRQGEARYRQLYENTPVMMHSIDATGKLVSVSDYWLDTLGYAWTEVVGRPSTDFLTAESQEYAREVVLPAYFKSGFCKDVPYQMICKNGSIIDVLLSATAERDESGAIVRSRAVLIDVTERKQAGIELNRYREHLEDMVAARASELQTANQRLQTEVLERQQTQTELAQRAQALERSNADLEQFAYVISHDLQEPLRAMTVFSQLLQQRYGPQLDATAEDYIRHVVDGGSRMQALIDGLLTYSRVTHRNDTYAIAPVVDSLTTALDNLQATLTETTAVVTHDELPHLWIDSSQITQLFQNLIGNALKFRSAAPPCIHISAQQQPDSWRFSIQDNGIGIADTQQSRIFDLFQRLHTREERSGYGIGLAICKKIVQRHNGTLWVESTPTEGATFYFTLALQSPPEESPPKRVAPQKSRP